MLDGGDATGGGTSLWSAEGVLALTGTFGMMSGRSLALGASTTMEADESEPGAGG